METGPAELELQKEAGQASHKRRKEKEEKEKEEARKKPRGKRGRGEQEEKEINEINVPQGRFTKAKNSVTRKLIIIIILLCLIVAVLTTTVFVSTHLRDNPSQEKTNSSQEKTKTNSLQEMTSSSQEKTNSSQEKRNSLQEKTNSLQEKTNSLQEKTNSLQEKTNSLQEKTNSLQEKTNNLQLLLKQGKHNESFLNSGMRQGYQLQDCQSSFWKKSFPNLDYAFLGYDILKGYPLASGHDAGFTHPIFQTDYTSGKQTTDCRYSVPAGLLVVPDLSCEISFTSEVIRNNLQMSNFLAAAVNVKGGGFGFQFSASAGYKESVATMSSGEFLYIISQAQCRYYFSKIDVTNPPPFHPGFVNWAKRLSNPAANDNDVMQFIKYYGTHYASEVTFGARFMKNHKVSQTKYEELTTKKISVEAQASYSGKFSVGGGISMDKEQRDAVSNFQKSVETSTITVGAAPPSNGDAMTWASTVQDNPVPITYSLSAIHNLFTERYSKHLPGVDIKAVRQKLVNASNNYCEALKKDGTMDSCESIHFGTSLQNVRLDSYGYRSLTAVDETNCRAVCLLEEECVAVQYRTTQTNIGKISFTERRCKLLDPKKKWKVHKADDIKSKLVVFLPRLQREKKNFILNHLKVKANQLPRGEFNAADSTECSSFCEQDAFCQAFVWCNRAGQGSWCENTKGNCHLYSKQQITAVEKDENSEMHFVWKDYFQVTLKID